MRIESCSSLSCPESRKAELLKFNLTEVKGHVCSSPELDFCADCLGKILQGFLFSFGERRWSCWI